MPQLNELKTLWKRMLGTPPSDEQFEVWTALHTLEVVRQAIVRTAAKDLSLGKTMTADFKIRFASKVMLTQTERNGMHAANRARLREEFEGASMQRGTNKEISEKADDGVTVECE
jgi:hypothetical protein